MQNSAVLIACRNYGLIIVHTFIIGGLTTEYTESGNGRALRTFHHDGKITPSWWWSGCTPTPFHHVQSCSVRSSWEGTPPYVISTHMYSVGLIDWRKDLTYIKCILIDCRRCWSSPACCCSSPTLCGTDQSIIYSSRILCLCVCVCVSQFVSERYAILLVLIIKLTKETRQRVWRGRDTDGEIGKGQIGEWRCD